MPPPTFPVAIGVVARVGEIADGVIIGTRLVRAVADADGRAAAVDAVAEFLADARTAL